MGVIHKHSLHSLLTGPGQGEQVVHLFEGSTVLHFDVDRTGTLCLWVVVPAVAMETEQRVFSVRGTGEFFDGVPLRTTVVGGYVWHLVEHTTEVVEDWDGGEVRVQPAGDGRDWEAVLVSDGQPIRDPDGVPLRGSREDLLWRLG